MVTGLNAQDAGLAKLFKDYYETGLRLGPEGATLSDEPSTTTDGLIGR